MRPALRGTRLAGSLKHEVLIADDRKPRACPSLNIIHGIMLPPAGRLRSASRATSHGSRSTMGGAHRVAGDDDRHRDVDHAHRRRRHRARVRDVSATCGDERGFGTERRPPPQLCGSAAGSHALPAASGRHRPRHRGAPGPPCSQADETTSTNRGISPARCGKFSTYCSALRQLLAANSAEFSPASLSTCQFA